MKGPSMLLVAAGVLACAAGAASAQSFDLGHLGFGLLGGGPGLGIGSITTETGTATSAGASFGAKIEQPGEFTGGLGPATESLAGSEVVKTPSRLVPEDIPVGH